MDHISISEYAVVFVLRTMWTAREFLGGNAACLNAAIVLLTDLLEANGCVESMSKRRIELAKKALLSSGYFKESEIGDDIAPRIMEMISAWKDKLEGQGK